MIATADRLVEDYLDDLEQALADVPRARRRELVAEIADHIAEGRAELPIESEAEMRTLLDRIGEPAEIAAEALERFGIAPPQRRGGTLETLALVLLLPGSLLLPVIGWLAGVVLLWVSGVWTTRDKLIGTLVVPGGLLGAAYLFLAAGTVQGCVVDTSGRQTCTDDGPSVLLPIVLVVVFVIGPLVSTGYLAWRLKRAREAL